MGGLELSLQVLVHLEGVPHFFIAQELVGNLKWHQKLSCIRSSLELIHFGDEPMQKMLDSLFLSMDDIPLERWVEVTWVAEHLKETADSLLGFVLGFALDID